MGFRHRQRPRQGVSLSLTFPPVCPLLTFSPCTEATPRRSGSSRRAGAGGIRAAVPPCTGTGASSHPDFASASPGGQGATRRPGRVGRRPRGGNDCGIDLIRLVRCPSLPLVGFTCIACLSHHRLCAFCYMSRVAALLSLRACVADYMKCSPELAPPEGSQTTFPVRNPRARTVLPCSEKRV